MTLLLPESVLNPKIIFGVGAPWRKVWHIKGLFLGMFLDPKMGPSFVTLHYKSFYGLHSKSPDLGPQQVPKQGPNISTLSLHFFPTAYKLATLTQALTKTPLN